MKRYRKIVELHFGLDIGKKSREFKYIFARACYYYLLRKFTTYSLHDIGKSIGKNHATVINGLKQLDGMIQCKEINISLYNSLMSKFNVDMENGKAKVTLKQLVLDYNYLLLENDKLKAQIEELKETIYKLADLE